MRHGVDHKKFGKRTDHRLAMFANMASSLITHGRIETTVLRAKELRRIVEKLVTRGRVDTVHSRRIARKTLRSVDAVNALFEKVAPRFKDRNGGYTRVLKKSAPRTGDAAEMAFLEFVDYKLPPKRTKDEKKKDAKEAQSDKELEKQALAAGKAPVNKKEASPRKESSKKSTGASGGPKKSTTVRKISSSS